VIHHGSDGEHATKPLVKTFFLRTGVIRTRHEDHRGGG
jgi:hypothetical protein